MDCHAASRVIRQIINRFLYVLVNNRLDPNLLTSSTADRKKLRPGNHYNVLLANDGKYLWLPAVNLQSWYWHGISGVNPNLDSPAELLHTYLLGNDKYVNYDMSKHWDKKDDESFAVHLQSSSLDSLTLPPLRAWYMVQYKNSLIGKHFKALQQVAIFHLHDGMCDVWLFEVWKATGELGAYLWYNEIKDMDAYLVSQSYFWGSLVSLVVQDILKPPLARMT